MPPTVETPLELSPEQAQQASQLSKSFLGLAGLAILQGLLWIAVAVVYCFVKGEYWLGLLPLVIGAASVFTGAVAFTTSTDAKYIAEVPAHNRSHLSNTVANLNDSLGVYIGVGILLVVVLTCQLLF